MRQASTAANVSNTTWGGWENGDRPLSPRLRVAIAQTFDWPADWDTNLPAAPISTGTVSAADVVERLDRIEAAVNRLGGLPDAVAQLAQSLHLLTDVETEIEQQGATPPARRRSTGS